MRRTEESDDIAALAAWLLWEMFLADDVGKGDAAPSTPPERPKPPPPRAK